MKKLVSVMLACLMLCTAAFCVAEAADIAGDWYLASISMDDVAYNAADLGLSMTMTLAEDGTATLVANTLEDGSAAGTWTMDENGLTITIDGDATPATLADGTLSFSDESGATMTFTREQAEASTSAEAVAAEDVSAFNGTWKATSVGTMGVVIPTAGMEAQLGITDLNIVVDNSSLTYIFGTEETVPMNFVDGALLFEVEGQELLTQKIELLADGNIAYTSMGVVFYCEPVAE